MRSTIVLAIALGIAFATAPSADARRWRRSKGRYVFDVWKVKVPKGLPQQLEPNIRKELKRSISKNKRLMLGVKGAPDPVKFPKKFLRHLRKHRVKYYRVNVELTKFERKVLPMPGGKRGKRLQVSLSVRTFGTTYPKRIIAFAGWGSGKVIIETGRRGPRKRDEIEAVRAALEVAIQQALARSIKKLDRPRRKPGNR